MVCIFDRQMRLLPALWLKWAGNIVLCDRFYYDDEIQAAKLQSVSGKGLLFRLQKWIGIFLRPRMWVKPDLTIFLDVDPHVAWARKPDHEFDRIEQASGDASEFMARLKDVVVIDANRDREQVLMDVYAEMYKLVRNGGKR